MLGQAPTQPPDVQPFEVRTSDTPGRFLGRVVLSLPRVTLPATLLAMVWQVGESAVPMVMGLAIDRALAPGDAGQLVLWIGALVAVYVALTGAARLTNRLNSWTIQLLQHRLRATLSAGVLHPHGDPVRAPDGDVVSVMTNDVARLANAGLLAILPIARIAAIGFIAASLLTTHWPLGVVVLLGAPAAVWLMGALSERLSRGTREYQDLLAGTVARATDLVTGYRVIKGVRAEAEATRRYQQVSRETLVGAERNAGLLGRYLVGSGVVSGTFVAGVTGLAGWFAVTGQLSIGGLIASVGLTQALLPQLQAIASVSVPNYAGARASAARILDALRNTGTPDHRPAPETTAVPVLEVSVSGTSFRVERGELVGVRAEHRIAARVAYALLDPFSDNDIEVCLDERPVSELASAQYRCLITVAPHRVTLFSGTIRDNLAVSTQAPEVLEAAAWAAACEDFAADLAGPVGEGGNRLSGGQRQRVALARALATGAPLLVLHDPTTAVDSVTEQRIAERLPGVRADRSTLLITSSPALLGCCDRIVDLA